MTEAKVIEMFLRFWWWKLFPKYYIGSNYKGNNIYISVLLNGRRYVWDAEIFFAYKFTKRQAKRFIKEGKKDDPLLENARLVKSYSL